MTAPTAQDFEAAALSRLADKPNVARLVQAGDPRTLAQIRAQAAMLTMMAEQIDNAQFEAFVKSRDSTVMADATLKGILPLARSARASLTVTNGDAVPYTLASGRRLLDPKGRIFMVDSDVTIAAGASAAVAVTQKTQRSVVHTVTSPTPYYRIEVTTASADTFLTSLAVHKGGLDFTYAPDWFNVQPGDTTYQVETDERRRLMVCMGSTDVVGYGVQTGDTFTMDVEECEGKIEDLQVGSNFGLEYALSVADGLQQLVLASVSDTGSAPLSIADLRVISRYPSIYDHNAVYLGEFDMLLRRYMTDIQFLSVWNEQVEEAARGANVDNINKLFVSGRVNGMTDLAFQARATELIQRADDSYKIGYVAVVDTVVNITVTGSISVIHDKATTEAQIRGLLLANYAAGSPLISVGGTNPLRVQPITKLLKDGIAAFQDELSDFAVTIALPASPKPEEFLQITNASLTVTLTSVVQNGGLWNR